jgi:hypothetical protein
MARMYRYWLVVLSTAAVCAAAERHVGAGQTYDNLEPAAAAAQPGDEIIVHDGTYAGGQYVTNLKGTSSRWIQIVAQDGAAPVWDGGSQAWHLVDPAYVLIRGITFQNQTVNGVNVDDGGTYDTPAHNVVFDSCIFRDMAGTGNNDLLKLSGLDTFEIRGCTLRNGSADGSGIDMVGCHQGVFSENSFENMGSNAIQAKGGTRYISIDHNLFVDCGERAVNLGGSTGLEFFRPDTAHYEAADLSVYTNVFVGGVAPIAYVGCIDVHVTNNTIYRPGGYTIRILQETVDVSRFQPCGSSSFRNNIVYRGDRWSDCNIGDNTAPETFVFSNNLWYNYEDTTDHAPKGLPVADVDNVIGQYPGFADTNGHDFSVSPSSPAAGAGLTIIASLQDYVWWPYADPPSIGAYEANPVSVKSVPAVQRARGVARTATLHVILDPGQASDKGRRADLLGRVGAPRVRGVVVSAGEANGRRTP